MQCPACQHESPVDARFCAYCGAPLERHCARCRGRIPPRERSCPRCAHGVGSSGPEASPPPPPQSGGAERRQLTVLFCDLVDSTELASHLDPEEWHEVVRRFQQTCAQVIDRFEGHVAQYLGDGMVVYFGYPQAHEDDAERAVRAGLGMVDAVRDGNTVLRERHAVELAVRVGIHTGPVVVGEMRGGGRHETPAFGETMNVAARLQGSAEPDTVVLSSATLRLVSGIFVTRDRGARALKGLAEPLRIHQAIQPSGVRSRLDVMAAAELTPFIGRGRELSLLEDRYTEAVSGRGQAVLMCGEAGIGKSRVVQAFHERIAERPHTWLECRGSRYTRDTAFHPVLQLQQQALGFRPEDPAGTKLKRIELGLAAAGFDPSETVPLLADLHEIPLDERFTAPAPSPEGMRKKTLALLVAWLLRLGRRQPLVVLLEDLHWTDPSTIELVGEVLERIPTGPLLLVGTHRPEFESPWPARARVARITLGPLSRGETARMVERIAGVETLPAPLREQVVERSDGIPLFVEELTRAVLESDPRPRSAIGHTPEPVIPETLQDSLTARLDRLGPARDTAQLAAVAGREFSYELLASACGRDVGSLPADLERLERAGLVYRRGTPPRADYTFKHALVHETAYRSLLRAARHVLHARLARVLQERFPERVAAEPEVMARHCEEGGLVDDAIANYKRAGELAARRAANAEAIRHLTRALDLLRGLPEGPDRDSRELALQVALAAPIVAARGWGSPDAERAYGRARELCDRSEAPELFRVLRGLVVFYVSRAELATARDSCTRLLRLAEAHPEGSARAVAHQQMAIIHYYRGEGRAAYEHYQRALALYDPADRQLLTLRYGQDLGVFIRVWLAWCLWILGLPDRALGTAREAIDLARQAAHPFSLAYAVLWCAVVHVMRRERRPARELAARAIDIGREEAFDFIVEGGRVVHGWSRLGPEKGPEEHDAVIAEMRDAGARMAATGSVVSLPMNFGVTADALRTIGHTRDVLDITRRALAFSERTGDAHWDADLYRIQGNLLAEEGGEAEAEGLFRRALDVSRSQHAKSLELRAATGLARLWQRQGRLDDAHVLLRPVYEGFTEGFDTRDLKDAEALLEEPGGGRASDRGARA